MANSSTLNIDSIELISTIRTAPLNGAPSSQDYNDSQRECLEDLAAIADSINQEILPLLNCLGGTDSQGSDFVLNGDTVFASSDTSNALFQNPVDGSRLAVADVLNRLNTLIQSNQTTLTTLSARVSALTTQLSSSNQNDIAKAIQGYAAQLQEFYNQVGALSTNVSTLMANDATFKLQITDLYANGGGGGTGGTVDLTAINSAITTLQTQVASAQSVGSSAVSQINSFAGPLMSAISGDIVAAANQLARIPMMPAWSKFVITPSGANWLVNGVSVGTRSSSGTTQQIPLFTTLPRQVFMGLIIKVTTAMVGVGSGTGTVVVGSASAPDALMMTSGDYYDITRAVSDSEFYSTGGVKILNFGATPIVLQVVTNVSTPAGITAGAIEIDILTCILK